MSEFLAMPVDDFVVRAFMKPNRHDGSITFPTLSEDFEKATSEGVQLWVVVETVVTDDGKVLSQTETIMTAPDFFAAFKLVEPPEFKNDWYDAVKY